MTAHRVGSPRAGILNQSPVCSFGWREELQIRSLLWTKIFKQEAPLLASPAVRIPGDLASPSRRGHKAKGVCELTDHEIPLLREALDMERRVMKYPTAKIFSLLLLWSFLLLRLSISLPEAIILGSINPMCLNKSHSNSENPVRCYQLWQQIGSNQYPLTRVGGISNCWFQNQVPFISFETKRREGTSTPRAPTLVEPFGSITYILLLRNAKFQFCLGEN